MTEMNDATKEMAKVIMPAIRRVMPNIIANDILGVQPMTGPVGQIFGQVARYSTAKSRYATMNKAGYKQFLRLNDRKRRQYESDFVKAKYPYHDVPRDYYVRLMRADGAQSMLDWLEAMMPHSHVLFAGFQPRIYFENENDRLMFILRWS
jgi:hypothetical protein